MSIDSVGLSIIGPALLAGLLVTATHVPLGMQVLARGIIFVDIAIAQIAGVGVIAADAFGFEHGDWSVQLAALAAALVGAFFLTWTERRWPEVQEAIIGAVFILAASGSVLLLAGNPHGGEHLKDLLVGQILWVGTRQLVLPALVYLAVLGLWFGMQRHLGRVGFYALFAVVVTVSVQLVGIYLVFATLIIPALATRRLARRRLAVAYAVSAIGYAAGLALSAAFDLPAGPIVCWMLAAVGLGMHASTGVAFRRRGPQPVR